MLIVRRRSKPGLSMKPVLRIDISVAKDSSGLLGGKINGQQLHSRRGLDPERVCKSERIHRVYFRASDI